MTQTDGKTIVNSWNEWDPLKRVIVGRPDGSCQPKSDPGWDYYCPKAGFEFGPMPAEMVEKARDQMDNFSKILEDRGVLVERAVPIECNQKASTPDWEVEVMHGCMPPRDVLLPVGNEILECTMSIRARWYEYLCYRPILERYFKEDPNFQWISAPKPRLTDESYEKDYYNNFNNVWTKAEKKTRMLERHWHLTEKEPLFDAADGMRFGKDVIWQASSVSNGLGIDWLRRHFKEKDIRLHVVQFTGDYHAWHIDIHLVPLRPGLCMYNPKWHYITPELENFFKINDWELIPAAEPVHVYDVKCGVVGARRSTEWISMNTFSIDPKTVCVEAHETQYMDQLDKLGFEVIPVPFADVFPFGGGLHCATVDVYREGNCEDYFPNQIDGF
jgi:glycine amidinotransferase